MMRTAAIALCLFASAAGAPPWSPDLVDTAGSLPVQAGGRVKPLSTHAGIVLLQLNGRRTCTAPDGERLGATEWLLDVLFRPETAADYPHFLVPDRAVIEALGAQTANHARRDRYSYAELAPVRKALHALAARLARQDRRGLSTLERQTLDLAANLRLYESLAGCLDFARFEADIPQDGPIAALLPNGRMSTLVQQGPLLGVSIIVLEHGWERLAEALPDDELERLRAQLPEELAGAEGLERRTLVAGLQRVLGEVDQAIAHADALALFPPFDPRQDQWYTPGQLIRRSFEAPQPLPEAVRYLVPLEEMARATDDPTKLGALLGEFRRGVMERLAERGRREGRHIGLERAFHSIRPFFYALLLFILAFVAAALSWLMSANRALHRAAYGLCSVAVLLLIAGIAMRCIIRGRPPVTTLYETILFVTAVCALGGLLLELTSRRRIALAVGIVLGVVGLFLAHRYELREAADTMPAMVAVLDTNFWLATHVTTITLGYGAGLLAAALSHVYLFALLLNPGGKPVLREELTRMVYGVLCFGLLFALIGTLLGGVWAAQSWGRFWGWDPKENGALMIILCELAILHGRKGGYLEGAGLHLASVFNGMVVAFSWWGVNLLGVGLHSYGHTTGVQNVLFGFYALEYAVLLAGVFAAGREVRRSRNTGAGQGTKR